MENSKEQKGKKNKHNLENITKEKFSYPRLINCTCSELQLHFPTICRSHLYDFVMDAIELSLTDEKVKSLSNNQLKKWIYVTAVYKLLKSQKRNNKLSYTDFNELNYNNHDINDYNIISDNNRQSEEIDNKLTLEVLFKEGTQEELDIVEKHYYLGWTFEDLANFCNCSISCIKMRNHRLIAKLREFI
jgi:hypothetical protein